MPKFSFYNGIIVAAPVLLFMVILTEFVAPFKALLTATFGHHWIAKVVVSIVLFLLAGFLLKAKESWLGKPAGQVAWKITMTTIILIAVLFVATYFLEG